jgi:hypothetical protein
MDRTTFYARLTCHGGSFIRAGSGGRKPHGGAASAAIIARRTGKEELSCRIAIRENAGHQREIQGFASGVKSKLRGATAG